MIIRANAESTSGTYSLVEFLANGTKLGEASAEPFSFTYASPSNGIHRLTAVATLGSGARLTSSPVNIIVVAPTTAMTLIQSNAIWRYNDLNVNLGTAWRDPAYSDESWGTGQAHLGGRVRNVRIQVHPLPQSSIPSASFWSCSRTLPPRTQV